MSEEPRLGYLIQRRPKHCGRGRRWTLVAAYNFGWAAEGALTYHRFQSGSDWEYRVIKDWTHEELQLHWETPVANERMRQRLVSRSQRLLVR